MQPQRYWIGQDGDSFTDGSKYSPVGPLNSQDDVIINGPVGALSIYSDRPITINSLTIDANPDTTSSVTLLVYVRLDIKSYLALSNSATVVFQPNETANAIFDHEYILDARDTASEFHFRGENKFHCSNPQFGFAGNGLFLFHKGTQSKFLGACGENYARIRITDYSRLTVQDSMEIRGEVHVAVGGGFVGGVVTVFSGGKVKLTDSDTALALQGRMFVNKGAFLYISGAGLMNIRGWNIDVLGEMRMENTAGNGNVELFLRDATNITVGGVMSCDRRIATEWCLIRDFGGKNSLVISPGGELAVGPFGRMQIMSWFSNNDGLVYVREASYLELSNGGNSNGRWVVGDASAGSLAVKGTKPFVFSAGSIIVGAGSIIAEATWHSCPGSSLNLNGNFSANAVITVFNGELNLLRIIIGSALNTVTVAKDTDNVFNEEKRIFSSFCFGTVYCSGNGGVLQVDADLTTARAATIFGKESIVGGCIVGGGEYDVSPIVDEDICDTYKDAMYQPASTARCTSQFSPFSSECCGGAGYDIIPPTLAPTVGDMFPPLSPSVTAFPSSVLPPPLSPSVTTFPSSVLPPPTFKYSSSSLSTLSPFILVIPGVMCLCCFCCCLLMLMSLVSCIVFKNRKGKKRISYRHSRAHSRQFQRSSMQMSRGASTGSHRGSLVHSRTASVRNLSEVVHAANKGKQPSVAGGGSIYEDLVLNQYQAENNSSNNSEYYRPEVPQAIYSRVADGAPFPHERIYTAGPVL